MVVVMVVMMNDGWMAAILARANDGVRFEQCEWWVAISLSK